MGTSSSEGDVSGNGRRRYDSPVRRQRVAETRDRIVSAGSELVHGLPSWDWGELTFRAVAERAGVGERTVYRHFPTERHLRDAVMQRLEQEAGVDYDFTLAEIPAVAARIFESLHAFAAEDATLLPTDPTFEAADERRQSALRAAVAVAAPQWSDRQQETAAALLDVVWNLPSYERLVSGWKFDGDRATEAIGWLIELLVASIDADQPPPAQGPPGGR